MERIQLGVAAMDRKARSKPMQNILNRLISTKEFDVTIFGEKVILDEPVQDWPIVDVLISFFSTGFPLEKAISYADLRKPVLVNDLRLQQVLWDRRAVLAILDSVGVPTPRRLEVDRDGGPDLEDVIIDDLKNRLGADLRKDRDTKECKLDGYDQLSIGGNKISKPFVEKPVSGEDHNIHIYFPEHRGGGGRRLFRKVGNKSSEYDPNLVEPRSDGSYIYEEFMDVDNAEDIKVYTIGPHFVHAETRKSPVVDGVVKRNPDGKEIRYITKLSDEEITMATSISKAFKQNICGFDLLRVGGKSYVIDVNGWSFVKGNDFYYDKCAEILSRFCKNNVVRRPIGSSASGAGSVSPRERERSAWNLKASVTVFRHGDRTPKQKLKRSFKPSETWAAPLIALLQGRREEIILRTQLDLVSTAASEALALPGANTEDLELIIQLINRKKDMPGTKVQIKPNFDKASGELAKMQLIIKWGGEFSHAARHQARDFGNNMRKDMIIMNADALDNCTVYTSSERRVTASAEIFAAAFLDESSGEKEMIIRKDLLDDSNAAKDVMDIVKKKLKASLRPDSPEADDVPDDWPEDLPPPAKLALEIASLLGQLRAIMRHNYKALGKGIERVQTRWCTHETPQLFRERWEKLFNDFEEDPHDPSRSSELYDMLSHDGLHNRQFIETVFADAAVTDQDVDKRLTHLHELYRKALALFSFICPREYGITPEEKEEIGFLTSMPLLTNIVDDLKGAKESNGICSLYFTKESHIHTLLNLVLASELNVVMPKMPPLDYFASITFEVYERSSASGTGSASNSLHQSPSSASLPQHQQQQQQQQQYSLLISVSEGAHSSNILSINLDARHALTPLPRRPLTTHMDFDDAMAKLEAHSSRDSRVERGMVEGSTVFFGQDDPDRQFMPIKNRRDSVDTDRSSVRQG
ncbi:probable VIP1-actin cytoskeleton organization and biogenesis-related protein [Sporisorium reilianum f. sp. reilianum]|uniref:Inositol hexakisphosphate and diphosphoinositol-pentakisphosphate kinase n=1 Tax=Sporisorium reilianum f. sp. reilianum TaxID=72559 RepID=A0A2N8UP66_9BASI|nr:probable VIP1-actin cytoskeleton organization and biogenesis-related protein [Sporisorium reilianum f. sp. reilianum]